MTDPKEIVKYTPFARIVQTDRNAVILQIPPPPPFHHMAVAELGKEKEMRRKLTNWYSLVKINNTYC